MPTRALVQRAQAGDQAAFADLHRRFAPRVRGLVAVRMGRALAEFVAHEDVVHETLAAAFAQLGSFDATRDDASFACWLAHLVERRLGDHARAQRADKRGGGRALRMADLRTTQLQRSDAPAPGPSPSQAVQQREIGQAIETALLTLSERYRVVVYCRLVLTMDFAAIAEFMALANAATACALFHKATARLAARLTRAGFDPRRWPGG